MIQTLYQTITTAILWLFIALAGWYLVSHAPTLAQPLSERLNNAVNMR